MPDREKVIKGLESCIANNCRDCPYPCYCEYADDWPHDLHKDALELLKEREAEIEQLNRFVNGFSRNAMPVVRCKDCKHRPTYHGAYGAEINGKWCYWCELLRAWKHDDWFCADGERKDDDD